MVYKHAPVDYDCPYCKFLAGKESEYNNADDIVARNESAAAFVGPLTWMTNKGSVLVAPDTHYENMYEIPDNDLAAVFKLAKQVGTAMRSAYGCGGITIIQRNEPVAGQHIWHLHVQVVPRYPDDAFLEDGQTHFLKADERVQFAVKLRDYLHTDGIKANGQV